MKNKKDGGLNAVNFFGFQRRFLEIFFALATPHGFRSNSKELQKTQFLSHTHSLKDCGGFKGRREMSRYQVVPFAISGCNLSAKVYASDFLVGFQREKPSEIR